MGEGGRVEGGGWAEKQEEEVVKEEDATEDKDEGRGDKTE